MKKAVKRPMKKAEIIDQIMKNHVTGMPENKEKANKFVEKTLRAKGLYQKYLEDEGKIKVKVLQYPQTFEFETGVEFPPFEYGCKKRCQVLLKELKRQKIHSPMHAYEDYVVEIVKKSKFGENWELGS